jgi:hypothetical protein
VKVAKAPWTDDQVRSLNDYQASGLFHPYTCGNCREDLVAMRDGWTCSCGYTQNWAHWYTANDGWRLPAAQMRSLGLAVDSGKL